ncbi:MAG: PD-(D/E)XK nuclease family protein [Fibrobacteres bacterium]|nr:PD-(D/E)XK nuclease family protein [Fibrobacterota bacterium]
MAEKFVKEDSWSNSRYDTFNRCRTEYFFDKVVSKNGWDSRNCTKTEREAFILKNTRNRYAWSGDLVHTAIEDWVDSFRKGSVIDRDTILSKTDTVMRQQYRDSRDQKYRDKPKKHNGLVEHENSLEIPDSEWKSIHDNVKTCLINFFYTDLHKSITSVGVEGVIRPERLDSFMLGDLKVYARPDIAIKSKHSIRLIDWKTGKANDDNDLQMVYYALYAVKKLKYPIEAIETDLIYLRENINKSVVVNREILQNAEDFILSTHSEMAEFEKSVSKETSVTDLSPATSSNTCRLCRFQKICPNAVKRE